MFTCSNPTTVIRSKSRRCCKPCSRALPRGAQAVHRKTARSSSAPKPRSKPQAKTPPPPALATPAAAAVAAGRGDCRELFPQLASTKTHYENKFLQTIVGRHPDLFILRRV